MTSARLHMNLTLLHKSFKNKVFSYMFSRSYDMCKTLYEFNTFTFDFWK